MPGSRAPRRLVTGGAERLVNRVRRLLPEGRPLPEGVWQRRHRAILVVLWLHAIGIVCFGLIVGAGLGHSLVEGAAVGLTAVLAGSDRRSRTWRAGLASLGLITASAVLVHLSGGYIELHFHFFVMVILISLYQDWSPFLLAIGYVVVHHGLVGTLDPVAVYNHPDAWAHPWKWALIHGLFVLAASSAAIVNWRLSEVGRVRAERAEEKLRAANAELEHRVTQRTMQLEAAVEDLEQHIAERTTLEAQLTRQPSTMA